MNHSPTLPSELRLVEKITYWMDNAITVPFTKFKFGIDPLLSFFPVAGSAVSLLISSLTLLAALRSGVGKSVVFAMLGNILLDFMVGNIPILGNIFDFAYKANTRNLKMLQEYYATGTPPKNPHKAFLSVILLIFVSIILTIFVTIWLVWWLVQKMGWIGN
jgi:hypothetical protein